MKRFLFSLTPLLISASMVNGQTLQIQGVAVDGGNQKPVEFATVTIYKAADSTIVQGALTDSSGHFRVGSLQPGSYLVSISSLEYAKLYKGPIEIKGDSSVVDLGHVGMFADQKVLREVTVRGERSLVEQRPDGLVVNLENSILSKGRNGTELLGILPLIQVGNSGDISVRGKSNVLVLIDNRPYYGQTLNMMLSNMKSEDVIKVEVITNPPAKYDAAASGGVVNIVTRRSLQNGWTGQFDGAVSQGRRLRYRPRLNMGYRYEKFAMSANVGYGYYYGENNQHLTNLFQSDNQLFDNRGVHEYKKITIPVSLGVSYNLSKSSSVGLTFDYNNNDNRDYINETAKFRLFNENSPLLSGTQSSTQGSASNSLFNYSAYYEGKFKKSSLNFIGTFSNYDNSGNSNISYNDFDRNLDKVENSDTDIKTSNRADIRLLVSQIDYSYEVGTHTSLEVGVKGLYTESDNAIRQFQTRNGVTQPIDNQFENSGYKERILAAYLGMSHQVGKVKLNASIRAEQTDSDVRFVGKRDFLDWFPSLLLHSKPSENYQWGVSFSRKINRPPFAILIPFVSYSGKYAIRQGNPALTPQYNNNFEFSQTFKGLNVILGYTHIKDAMFDIPKIDDQTKVTTFLYQNMDKQSQYSLSVTMPFTPVKGVNSSLTLFGSYSVLSDPGLNQNIAFSNSLWSGYVQVVNTIALPHKWKGEVLFYYQAPRIEGIDRLRSNSSLDLGIGRPIFNARGNIKLSVSDLFLQRRWRGSAFYGNVNMTVDNFYDTRRVQLAFSYGLGKKTVKRVREKSLGNEEQRGRMQ